MRGSGAEVFALYGIGAYCTEHTHIVTHVFSCLLCSALHGVAFKAYAV